MTDITNIEQNKGLKLNLVPDILFHPGQAFKIITTYIKPVWLTPILILSIVVFLNIMVSGRIKNQLALSDEITYPPDFQNYPPEQQAQYMQAIQSTQGPVFTYVLPAISSLLGVWFSWLILGGALHLVTTLVGGRGSTAISINIVAWASLPLALREIIQFVYMLSSHKLIDNPGLSGFSPAGDSGWPLFISLTLRLIDIYLIWQVLLLIVGVRISTGLNITKSTLSVVATILLILIIQTGFSYLISLLGNLTITRPFFF